MKTLFALIQILALVALIVPSAFAAKKGNKCADVVTVDVPMVPEGTKLFNDRPVASLNLDGSHNFTILPSGHDGDVVPIYERFVHQLNQPNGVLDKLGIYRSDQIVQFLPGPELNAIAKGGVGGALPVAHYLDGSTLLSAYSDTRSIIFEVVYPGPIKHHGFYRDDNTFNANLSILLHVVGHNHFAARSGLEGYRGAHVIEDSLEMSHLLERLYLSENKDEVARWYLFLQSITPHQDFAGPFRQTPDEFELESYENDPEYRAALARGETPRIKHPKRPTENVLPAFVANIPKTEPKWKRMLAEFAGNLVTYQPPLVHTQIMNEGWATMLQELVMKHVTNIDGDDFNTDEYWIEAQKYMNTESRINLGDPYWLGVNGWRNLYEIFRDRPEIKDLSNVYDTKAELELEIDRRFIAYADEIINTQTDEEFLHLALTETWLNKNDLSVVRRATPQEAAELYPNMPPPPPSQEPLMPWVVVTREKTKVIKSIIEQVLHPKFKFRPRLKLRSFNRAESGEVDLRLEDEIGRNVPLNNSTIGPTLYAFSQILKKPISLESVALNPDYVKPPEHFLHQVQEEFAGIPPKSFEDFLDRGQRYYWDRNTGQSVKGSIREYYESWGDAWGDPMDEARWEYENYWLPYIYSGPKTYQIRTVVTSNGSVKVYRTGRDNNGRVVDEVLDEKLTAQFEAIMGDHLADLYMEDDAEIQKLLDENPKLREQTLNMAAQIVNDIPADRMAVHAETAASALHEFSTFLERRLHRALARALEGKGGLIKTSQGYRLKALPSIARLQYDFNFLTDLQDEAVPAPIQPYKQGMTADDLVTIPEAGPTLALAKNFYRGDYSTDSNVAITPNKSDGDLIMLPEGAVIRPELEKNIFDGGETTGDGQVAPIPGQPGDGVWGPRKPPPGGGGSGNDEGDGGQSHDPNDPSWVPIPDDLIERWMGENIQLPNLNRKKGKAKFFKKRFRGNRNQRTGIPIADMIVMNMLEKGIAATEAENLNRDEDEEEIDPLEDLQATALLGTRYMHPERDWVVKDTDLVPDPDINAVVTFVMDGSGSTWGSYDVYKRFVNDLMLLIKANYKNVDFRFVAFDTVAHEYANADEFFRAHLGGGTRYGAGLEKTTEIFEENYPRSNWDRFTFMFGDLQDGDPEIINKIEELIEISEYMGLLNSESWPSQAFYEGAKELAQRSKFFGFHDIGNRKDYNLNDLKKLLKNDED